MNKKTKEIYLKSGILEEFKCKSCNRLFNRWVIKKKGNRDKTVLGIGRTTCNSLCARKWRVEVHNYGRRMRIQRAKQNGKKT